MLLRWKVQNPWAEELFIEVRLPELHFTRFAPADVFLVHVGKAVLEIERDSLAHNSNTVDRIYKSLRLRLEYIARLNRNLTHLAPLFEKEMSIYISSNS